VRLYSRPGNDLTDRFPLIVEALARLRARSCVVDGEAVCCGDDGVRSFDRIHYLRRAHRGWRADRLRPRLQDGARRHRIEAEGFALSFRPISSNEPWNASAST
jgi:hypothetical protein